MKKTTLGDGSVIDPATDIRGFVQLGKNSRIGRNVVIGGNAVIGDDTVIENGVIINGNAAIGSNCYLANFSYVEDNSTIGDRCVVNHCAELDGMIMENVYLYHYMEIFGIIGMNTILMPGVKVGPYSVIGPGTLVTEDVPSRTALFVKQEHMRKEWGPERYGW